MQFLRRHFTSLSITCLLVLLSLWSIWPLFHEGLHTSHDIWHQVARIHHFTAALSEGVLLPQWIMQLAYGHGYPLFVFSYHFPWLFSFPLILLGFSETVALKITFGFFFVAAAASMYWLAHYLTKKRWIAFMVAALYLVAPYHYLSLYVAAAIGTVIVYALLPLTVLGIHWIVAGKLTRGICMVGGTVAAMVLSHLMSVALFAPVLVVYALSLLALIPRYWKRSLLGFVAAAVLAVALSAYYIIPLIVYLPATSAQAAGNGFSELYRSYFITPRQLLYSAWGFGPIVSNAKDGEISLQLGLAHWAGLFAALGALILRLAQKTKQLSLLKRTHLATQKISPILWLTLLCTFVSSLLLFDVSEPFWTQMTKVSSVDFPFRLLLLTVFFSSLATGLAIATFKNAKLQAAAVVLFTLLTIYANRNHVRVNLYWTEGTEGFIASEVTTNTFHEYAPQGVNVKELHTELAQPVINYPSKTLSESTQHRSIFVEATQSAVLELAHVSFPGIQTQLNGEIVQTGLSSNGRILLPVEAGSHEITVTFVPTLLSRFALGLSALTTACTLGLLVSRRKQL